jgi:hypothetical protein
MCPSTDEDKAAVSDLPYQSLVGSLMYLAIGTRPDISFAVQQLTSSLIASVWRTGMQQNVLSAT